MNATLAAEELFADYGKLVGLPFLGFEHHGCARLVLGGSTLVDVEIDRECCCVQLYGTVGEIPASGREPVYRKMLEGNFSDVGRWGSHLAIDGERNELLLCRQVPLATATAVDFAAIVEEFAGALTHWRASINATACESEAVLASVECMLARA